MESVQSIINRPDKIQYYLDIAQTVAERSTCLRKHYGAVIVKDDEVVSTGYNGSPRDTLNCVEIKTCYRKEHNIPSGEHYELCRSVHAEANAIISAPRKDMIGATLYLAGYDYEQPDELIENHTNYVEGISCCMMCRRMIINSGIENVICRINADTYRIISRESLIAEEISSQ